MHRPTVGGGRTTAWWRRAGEVLGRRTGRTLIVAAVLVAVLGLGLSRLDFATGQDSYLDKNSTVAKDNTRYQSLFGGENMVVLFTVPEGKTVVDLFSPANIQAMNAVQAELQKSEAIESVVSPVALLQWTQDMITKNVATTILSRTADRETDAAAKDARQKDLATTAMRLAGAGAQSFDNPEWLKFLLFGNDGFSVGADGKLVSPPDSALVVRKPLQSFVRDSRHAIFAGILQGNAPLADLAKGSDAVKKAVDAQHFENTSITVTGTPTFLTDINNYLQGGMLTLGGLAVLVMIVILVIAFGVRWRLLPLLGMLVGVLWGFGAFGLTGTKLSLVTIAGLPILIGLGIEFAIQVQNRIEEERTVDRDPNPFGETMAHMGPPLLTATVAAVIAFLTVRISKVPMVQDFGLLLSIGIVALLAAGIVLPVAVIGARERRRPTTKPPGTGWVEKTVHFLGELPRTALIPLVLLAVALPIVGLLLEGGTRIESDPINWADQSSQTIKNARLLEHEAGMATTLGVFVETNGQPANATFTDQMGAFVTGLVAQSQKENPEIVGASSLATTVGWLTEVPGATPLPPTGLDMLEAYNVAPPALQQALVGSNGNAAQILFQLGPSSLEQRAEVLKRVQGAIAQPSSGALLPANASATTGGLAVVGVGLLDNITANRAQLTIAALLLVGAFLVLLYRDLLRGLLTMVPVLLAVGTSAVLVRVLNITLSPLTVVGGPLVVATCAEFAVLLLARYVEERRRGLDPGESNRIAAERTGRAFFTSALTTLGGFAVLMLSPLPLLADFGLIVTINIGVAVLSALVVIPPLVNEADRRGLLAVTREDTAGHATGWRKPAAWIGGAALLAVGLIVVISSTTGGEKAVAAPTRTPSAEVPATTPPPTTIPPTTLPPTTVAGETTVPGEAPTTLPPGPAERPSGLVAGLFWDALTKAGVDPGVARCAADDLTTTTPEAQLLSMGIANSPRPPEVDALLRNAGLRCGITDAQLQAASGG
jgi:hydrophobe/amphiphile efflux-3 (HAE3) family protein